VELRFVGSATVADAEQFERDAQACIARVVRDAKKLVVICTDARATHLFPPEVTDRLIQAMRRANPNLERNGMFGNGSAILTLQIARFIKDAANENRRRVFTREEPLLSWLDEVLTEPERTRMRRFLDELDPSLRPTPQDLPESHLKTPTPPAKPRRLGAPRRTPGER
jgi:hypothetical protein